MGEHFVRPDIVEERYIAGLKLLDHYFEHPDVLEIFDNSKTMELVAECRKGQIVMVAEMLPDWVTRFLSNRLRPNTDRSVSYKSMSDIDAVRKSYQALKGKQADGK